jgi:hypothetical protein
MLRFRTVFLCLILIASAGALHADEITYLSSGTFQLYTGGPWTGDDSLFGINGKPFFLTAQLTDFTPAESSNDFWWQKWAAYNGTGTLQIGSDAPMVAPVSIRIDDIENSIWSDTIRFTMPINGNVFDFSFSLFGTDHFPFTPPAFPPNQVVSGAMLILNGEKISYTNQYGTIEMDDGSIYAIDNLTLSSVPEPTSLLLLGIGLGAIGWATWRRRK